MVSEVTPPAGAPRPWSGAIRVAFRFCFVYFSLYVVFTQMLGSMIRRPVPQFGEIPPMRTLVSWTATRVFHVTWPLVITGSGSGDKTYDWVQVFCFLTIAAAATAVWSLVDRRRQAYVHLHKWFHVFVRLALGATMIEYGMVKAIPLQMPQPDLLRLIEPFGNFSPMGVLWYSIGASRPYEIFTGCAELLAGILLFVPQAVLAGALVSLADAIQIFTLNMTYDVPVKLMSFHLIVLALYLIAPDARRLLDVLFLNRGTGPPSVPAPGGGRRARRIIVAVQLLYCVYILGMSARAGVRGWYLYGGGAPKPPLYGIWTVDEMARDGVLLPPLLTDQERWRRVVFPRANNVTVQRMNETLATYASNVDVANRSLTLTKATDKSWTAKFVFEQPAPERLVVDGEMDGHRLHVTLARFDHSQFLLNSRGFNWIQEYPFNR